MSALDDLRKLVLTGGDGSLPSRAVLDLADRIVALEKRVFPPEPLATDPAVIAAEPFTTERPQLTGENVKPETPPVEEPPLKE